MTVKKDKKNVLTKAETTVEINVCELEHISDTTIQALNDTLKELKCEDNEIANYTSEQKIARVCELSKQYNKAFAAHITSHAIELKHYVADSDVTNMELAEQLFMWNVPREFVSLFKNEDWEVFNQHGLEKARKEAFSRIRFKGE